MDLHISRSFSHFSVKIGNTTLESGPRVRNFGSIFDRTLSKDKFVNHLVVTNLRPDSTCARSSGRLLQRNLRYKVLLKLEESSLLLLLKSLIFAYVTLQLDY